MAVDTREKRFSVMNMGLPIPFNLFEADGSVDSDDRAHLLDLYSGIAAIAAIVDIRMKVPNGSWVLLDIGIV